MKRFTNFMKLLGVATIVLTTILPVMAQDDVGECDVAGLVERVKTSLDNLSGDDEEIIRDLAVLSTNIDAGLVACSGLSFQDRGEQAYGPFTIPRGVYTVHLTTDGNFDTTMIVTDGECTSISGENEIFDYTGHDDASEGIETLFVSEGCVVFLQITASDAPWEMYFELMG